jgi:ABC-type oligopeptide transport system substrate-binding subunit
MNMGPSAVIDEHTERMAEIVDRMSRTLDAGRLAPLVQEAEEILADQVVFIPLYTRPQWIMWNTGLVGAARTFIYTWIAEDWYRTDL